MANEQITKFKKDDRIVVDDPNSWCNECHGTVDGVFYIPPNSPFYLVSLDKSPSPYISKTYVYENLLKKEEEEA